MAAPSCAGAKHRHKPQPVTNTMHVVALRQATDTEPFATIVVFTESQRFYKLPGDANPAYLELLRASAKDHTPVVIKRAREESDVILSVEKPPAQ